MTDELDTIRYFIDEVLVDAQEIGILVTPGYTDDNRETIIEYDIIETSDHPVSPHLDIRKELEAGENLEEAYFEECERLEQEFPEADIQYVDSYEQLAREMP